MVTGRRKWNKLEIGVGFGWRVILSLKAQALASVTYSLLTEGTRQSPTLGAHAHAHPCPWVLGGHGCGVIIHGWAWVRYYFSWVGIGSVHPCIQLQIRVKFLGCREYANQKALRAEAIDSERLFICPIQPRLGVGG
jgi:hypothetical protein